MLQALRVMPGESLDDAPIGAALEAVAAAPEARYGERVLFAYLLARRRAGQVTAAAMAAAREQLPGRDEWALAAASSLGILPVSPVDLADPEAPRKLGSARTWVAGFIQAGGIDAFVREVATAMRSRTGFWGLQRTRTALLHAVESHLLTEPAAQERLARLLRGHAVPRSAREMIARGISLGWPIGSASLLIAVSETLTGRNDRLPGGDGYNRLRMASLPMRAPTAAEGQEVFERVRPHLPLVLDHGPRARQ